MCSNLSFILFIFHVVRFFYHLKINVLIITIIIPFNLIGGKAEPIKLAWMYMSLPVGIVFLISVNIELILRNFLSNFTKLELPEDLDKQKLETQ